MKSPRRFDTIVHFLVILILTGCAPSDSFKATTCISEITQDCTAGYAEVNEISLYFEIHGNGKPVLVLHGGTGYIETLEKQVFALSKRYQVIAPDARGHGRSTDSSQPLSYELMGKDMIALMDRLGVQQAHIVGWSDGGIIGLELAMNYPERVNRLVVIGANFTADGVTDEAVAMAENATPENYSAPDVYRDHAPDPDKWPDLLNRIKRMYRSQPNYTREQLASINAPVLVIAGENEELIRPEHTRELHHGLGNSELLIVPDAGHSVPIEKPMIVNTAIKNFLLGQNE